MMVMHLVTKFIPNWICQVFANWVQEIEHLVDHLVGQPNRLLVMDGEGDCTRLWVESAGY